MLVIPASQRSFFRAFFAVGPQYTTHQSEVGSAVGYLGNRGGKARRFTGAGWKGPAPSVQATANSDRGETHRAHGT